MPERGQKPSHLTDNGLDTAIPGGPGYGNKGICITNFTDFT